MSAKARTAADARKMTDSQLFRGWRRRHKTDPAFFRLILEEVDRRAKATDFGRFPEWEGQDDTPKLPVSIK
jgi:hypothetical protein